MRQPQTEQRPDRGKQQRVPREDDKKSDKQGGFVRDGALMATARRGIDRSPIVAHARRLLGVET